MSKINEPANSLNVTATVVSDSGVQTYGKGTGTYKHLKLEDNGFIKLTAFGKNVSKIENVQVRFFFIATSVIFDCL